MRSPCNCQWGEVLCLPRRWCVFPLLLLAWAVPVTRECIAGGCTPHLPPLSSTAPRLATPGSLPSPPSIWGRVWHCGGGSGGRDRRSSLGGGHGGSGLSALLTATVGAHACGSPRLRWRRGYRRKGLPGFSRRRPTRPLPTASRQRRRWPPRRRMAYGRTGAWGLPGVQNRNCSGAIEKRGKELPSKEMQDKLRSGLLPMSIGIHVGPIKQNPAQTPRPPTRPTVMLFCKLRS